MKNLNKKIGVVVLSGLVLAGSGLVSGVSVSHAQRWDLYRQKISGDNLPKSDHEEKRWALKAKAPEADDVFEVVKAGESSFLDYNVLYVNADSNNPIKGEVFKGKDRNEFKNIINPKSNNLQDRSFNNNNLKDIKELKNSNQRLNKPSKYFNDVSQFYKYMYDSGYLLDGVYNMNVRGVSYIIKFNFNF